ncbi:hypothetical protein V5O48_015684 [Marasmius crinis-equi]|uniref:Heme haloperoxidase family profile domain-containing protein n=1 Tax=Marasmius crinis-equi TaxID=585013 RepID=A0ABR3ETU3_9AGAR
MKFQLSFASLVALSSCATVLSSVVLRDSTDPHDLVDWQEHQFQAATEGDARGPCPGLNALANHGFLPHNGKNITIPMVLKAGREGFNVHRDLLIVAAKQGVVASALDDQFALTDIGLHGNIEHDASLSRVDRDLGDHLSFSEEIYSTLANSNPDVDYYDTTSAGQVQKARQEHSQANNPKFRNTIKEFQIRTRESALYLAVMGDPKTGVAPKKFVNVFFREERLPLAEGWRISKTQVEPSTDAPLFAAIIKASEWQANPEQCPWVTLAAGAPEDPITDGSIL